MSSRQLSKQEQNHLQSEEQNPSDTNFVKNEKSEANETNLIKEDNHVSDNIKKEHDEPSNISFFSFKTFLRTRSTNAGSIWYISHKKQQSRCKT